MTLAVAAPTSSLTPMGAVLLSPFVFSPPHCGYPQPWDWCHPLLMLPGPPSAVSPHWPGGHGHCHARVVTGR